MSCSPAKALHLLLVALAACGSSRGAPPGATVADASAPDAAVDAAAFDASPRGWSTAPSVPELRDEAAAATIGSRIYFVGGLIADPTGRRAIESDLVDIYDPRTRVWSSGPPLPAGAPRHHLAVVAIGELLYVVGGFSGASGQFRGNAQTWVLDAGAWRRLADQPVARGAATAEVLGASIYVTGGGPTDGASVGDSYAYDPARDAWTARAAMPTPRQHVGSCAVRQTMIVLGGWINGIGGGTLDTVEAYDSAADAWATLPSMPTRRGGLEAIALNGLCYALGGEGQVGQAYQTFDANESFDLTLRAWRAAPPMPTARHGFGVTILGGEIYAVGGAPQPGDTYTNVVEVFAP